jgi:tetratricopeptide (TPR) repeat protein
VNARGAVFLSYASQDAEVARNICEALREAGIEVWFDQSELRGGDAWDERIRRNIRDCALFLPIISRHTQERAEGYFRLEWHLAEQRTYLIAGDAPFLVPVVVDDIDEKNARVPDRFRDRQWTRLVGKAAMTEFAERIARLLDGEPKAEAASPRAPLRVPAGRKSRRSIAIAVSLAAGAALIAAALLWLRSVRSNSSESTASPGPIQSPANDLLARAIAATKMPPGSSPSKEGLGSANNMLEQAKALDPTNGEIWAAEALNDLAYISNAFDESALRKSRVTAEVERAMTLAPHSFNARMAHAYELYNVVSSPGSFPEAEREMKKLLVESPGCQDIRMTLGFVLRREGRNKESAADLMEAGVPGQAAWEYLHLGDWKGMDVAADLALKRDPLDVDPKLHVELYGFEDPDAVRRILDGLPPQEMLKDNPVSFALIDRYFLREPQKMLDIASSFPGEWITSWFFLEPKAAWEGNAYRLLGQTEAAKAKWQVALKEIEDRLATTPDDAHLLLLKSDMNAALGRNDEAAAGVQLYEQLEPNSRQMYILDHLRWIGVKLRLGQRDEPLKFLEQNLRNPHADAFSFHGEVRFFPDLDPLRSDAWFQKLMRETKPPVARPLD